MHESAYPLRGKRLVLVVDDEPINRALLGAILEETCDVIMAENGREALALMEQNRSRLSLVLLDLKMPVLSGTELLKAVRADETLRRIPIIVLTADQDAEIESLDLGAIDFIPKPYPPAGVVLARVRRTIELSEDRSIIRATERDELTDLFSREYFYRYAEQFDRLHEETAMDAVVIDINHFRLLNERYGKAYANRVLRRVGEKLREAVQDSGGLVCRREADIFLLYCPHRDDYESVLEHSGAGLTGEQAGSARVRLRMGVYENADKTIDIERRFDRAQVAADTIRNNLTRPIAYYDAALHQAELFAEQLVEAFPDAIRERQFQVCCQPKFNVQGDAPRLVSAEALVRWEHPTLGKISPADFIPIFERNGLISELDRYVWHETAAAMRDWRENGGVTLPVSVNVSRVDMLDANLSERFLEITRAYGISPSDLLLEITESAYTSDSEYIIATVRKLRALGFRIEMDDFGTGYSSLGMISRLPIDALKLDMLFVQNAFGETRDTRMLELILDIAEYLKVPVIAEGVETKEQMTALRALGCEIIQGYYFSKPIPLPDFGAYIEEQLR